MLVCVCASLLLVVDQPSIGPAQHWTSPALDQPSKWTISALDEPSIGPAQHWTSPASGPSQHWTIPELDQPSIGSAQQVDQPSKWTSPALDQPRNWTSPALDQPRNWTSPALDQPRNWTSPALDQSSSIVELQFCDTERKMGSEEKSQKSLRRIVVSEAKTFMCHTTLHGAQHVGDDQRHKVGRVLWLLTLLSMAGGLLLTLSKLYGRYMTYPHTTMLIVSHSEYQPLPAVTVCLRDPVNLERLRLAFPQSHAMVEKFLTDKSALNWSDPLVAEVMGNVTLQQVMNQSSFRVEEIVVKATKAYAEIYNISQVFATRDFLSVMNPVRCYTYNEGKR
ncbi:hypothetical protein ACOMHN_055577 [Nucella lapillus]